MNATDCQSKKERERERAHPHRGEWRRKPSRCSSALSAGFIALTLFLWNASAFALLVGDDGLIEPIFVQIKDSLRTSADLDAQLAALDAIEKENGLAEVAWYAGPKLIVELSFPKEFTDDEAQKAISALQETEGVEKVVVQSAANLDFKSADFARSWKPGETIPDESRRGFDVDRLKRPAITYDEKTELPLHVANRIIVRWKDEYVWGADGSNFERQFADFNAKAECTVVKEFQYTDHDLTQVLEFDSVKYSALDQLLLYQANELIDYVQPDYIYDTTTVPNDPGYASYQWNLPKISMPSAWGNQTGSGSIVAAVLDTGANISHREFSPNLNSYHYDFADSDSDVADFSPYHGSNVASIIGAQGNNGLYVSGVAWDVSLLFLKVFKSLYPNETSTSILTSAIDSARTHGATVMNLSLGNTLCTKYACEPGFPCDCIEWSLDHSLESAIRAARDSGLGVVAVCAAGNYGNNNDSIPFAPSGLPEDNIISVAASDQNDARAIFSVGSSNDGFKTVDLAAPGDGIYGLTQNDNGSYSIFEGTSQAAPHVTGAIALLKSEYGWENYYGLRDRVLMGTDAVPWGGLLRTGGRLNVNKALHARTLIRNLSTRARVENGTKIMIGGFVIGGSSTGTLKVAIRGLGPSLDPFLTVPVLPNPKLTLNNSSGGVIYSNDNYGTLPTQQLNDLSANGLTPSNSLEAAMVQTLAPGAYTVFLESNNGTSFGVGLFEIYDLGLSVDNSTRPRLINVSTRCLVRTGEEVAIAGEIVGDPPRAVMRQFRNVAF